MPKNTPALRLGAPVRFKDRWAGKVSAIEVDEGWEVFNVAVEHGFPRAKSVRLPFEPATAWDDDLLAFDEMTSAAAFARELTPIAAPSRPISAQTPIGVGGRLAGVLVDPLTRHATEVLISREGRVFRIPAKGVTFEGKVLHPGVQPDALIPYYKDEELRERVRQALSATRELTPGEVQYVSVESLDDGIRLTGNVRTKQSREAARRAASDGLGVPVNVAALFDDIELESEIGLMLESAGLTRTAEVFVRCTLGDAVLFGYAPSQFVAEEVARTVARVPGVRAIHSRMEIGPSSGTAAPITVL